MATVTFAIVVEYIDCVSYCTVYRLKTLVLSSHKLHGIRKLVNK